VSGVAAVRLTLILWDDILQGLEDNIATPATATSTGGEDTSELFCPDQRASADVGPNCDGQRTYSASVRAAPARESQARGEGEER